MNKIETLKTQIGGGVSSEFKLFNRCRMMLAVDHPLKNNEIWYTTTNHKKLPNRTYCPDGGTLLYHYYNVSKDRGVIGYSKNLNGKLDMHGFTTLKTITLPDTFNKLLTNNTWTSGCFAGCTNLTHVYSQPLIQLSDGCFYNCSKLSNIEYDATRGTQKRSLNFSGSQLTALPYCSLRNCSGLSKNIFPNFSSAIKTYGGVCFMGVVDGGSTFYNVSCAEGVERIDSAAFYNSRLERLTLPSTVRTINGGIGRCIHLQSITSSSPNFVVSKGMLMNAAKTTIHLTIGHWGTNVTIPDSVTSIPNYAFSAGYNITRFNIGYGLSTIEDYAFGISSNSNHIVYIRRTISIINLKTYNGFITSDSTCTKIYVPDFLLDGYKVATNWSAVASKFEGYNPFSTACYEILADTTTGYATNSTEFQKIWVCGLDNPVTSQYPNGALAAIEACTSASDMYAIAINCGY